MPARTLLAFLLRPELPLWHYCLLASAAALLPSLALSGAVHASLALLGVDTHGLGAPDLTRRWADVVGAVLFAPLVETLLLALLLSLLSKLSTRTVWVAAVSASFEVPHTPPSARYGSSARSGVFSSTHAPTSHGGAFRSPRPA